jgi:pimeloyl-ACP methyl ester carboxylesterase
MLLLWPRVPAADIDVPVLLMARECNDWMGRPLQSKHVALFGNAQLSVIEDAGHAMLTDNFRITLAPCPCAKEPRQPKRTRQ